MGFESGEVEGNGRCDSSVVMCTRALHFFLKMQQSLHCALRNCCKSSKTNLCILKFVINIVKKDKHLIFFS